MQDKKNCCCRVRTGWFFFANPKSSFLEHGPGITSYFKMIKLFTVFYFLFSCVFYIPTILVETWIKYLDVGTIVFYLFSIAVLRYNEEREVIDVGSDTVSSEDYSIYIESVPEETTAEDLKTHFENLLEKPGCVFRVQLVERNKHIQKMLERRGDIIRTLEKVSLIQFDPQGKQALEAKFREQKEFVEENIRRSRMNAVQDAKAFRAFVTFEHSDDCDRVLECYKFGSWWDYFVQPFGLKLWGQHRLRIFRAPPPSTVLWKNLRVHSQKKRQILTWVASLVLIFLSFVSITLVKEKPIKNLDSIAVVAINFVLTQIVQMFAEFERHHSLNEQSWSVAQRLFLTQFMNVAMVPFVMEHFYDMAGTLSTVQFAMIYNIFTPHFPALLKYLGKRICSQTRGMTEREKTEAEKGPMFDLSLRFSSVFATLFTVMMYSQKIPMLYPVMCASMFVRYWVDKFLFVHFYSAPPWYSIQLEQSFSMKMSIAAVIHIVHSYFYYNQDFVFLILVGIVSSFIVFHFFKGFLCSSIVSCVTCGFSYEQEYEKPVDAASRVPFSEAGVSTYSMLELETFRNLFVVDTKEQSQLTEISHLV